MKTLLGLALITIIALTGCTPVISQHQLGLRTVKLEAEEWDGVWIAGEETVFFMKVKDAEKGVLRVGSLEDKDNDFKLQAFDAVITQGKHTTFCNIQVKDIESDEKQKDQAVADSYYWMRIESDKNQKLLHMPNASVIGKLVEEGTLKGIKGDQILLQLGSEEITNLVESQKGGELYHWETPVAIRRITSKLP